MADIDIGAAAVGRGSQLTADKTLLSLDNPANASGTITSIEIWAQADMAGLRVGTFFLVSGTTYQCRDSEAIAGTITAGSKVTKVVSIAVEVGDLIGCYYASGAIERDLSGYAGVCYATGENIDPTDQAIYATYAGDAMSLYGEGVLAGWTGKVSGVTDPAKIMGIAKADITKVSGVS